MITLLYNILFYLNLSAANKQFVNKDINKKALFICGYPRSGNSWSSFLFSYYFSIPFKDIDAKNVPKERQSFIKDLQISFSDKIKSDYGLLIKTHIQPERLKSEHQNLIYVLRDGRDVVTSYVHFLLSKWQGLKGVKGTLVRLVFSSHFFKNIIIDLLIGIMAKQWKNHILQSQHCQVVIKYENLKENHSKELSKSISKLNKSVSKETIENAIKFCSFKKMKERADIDKPKGNSMRKGIIGDWKNLFNHKRKKIFNKYAGDILIEYNYVKNESWINE